MAKAYQSFQALAFHADFGNEPTEGTILFTTFSLAFRSEQTSFEIPLAHLLATSDDTGEGRIIFHDSQRPELTITTCDMSVLELTSVPAIAQLTEEVSARLSRNELTRRIKYVAWFGIGCALVLWLGMLAMGAMVRSIVNRIPPDVEKRQGDAVLKSLEIGMDLLEQSNAAARLTTIAEPLLRAAPAGPSWQFHVIAEKSPNAFAVPGGHIVVTSGLLTLAERPEDVLGAVAHEMAHVTRKHAFRQQIASVGPLLVFQVFLRGRGGAMGVVAGGSALLVNQSFSQEYEKEADDTGWDYLVAANIDPRGMIEMFQKLKAVEATEKGLHLLPQAFESHPDLDKRIARLEKKWKRLPKKSGFIQLDADGF